MDSYSVRYKASAEKDARKIAPTLIANIVERIDRLAEDPLPRQSLKLSGGEEAYRLRVGDYRVVYKVDHESRTVTIQSIRHRRDVYRNL